MNKVKQRKPFPEVKTQHANIIISWALETCGERIADIESRIVRNLTLKGPAGVHEVAAGPC